MGAYLSRAMHVPHESANSMILAATHTIINLSPVYMQRLARIGIRIELIQVRVNVLTRIRIRIT